MRTDGSRRRLDLLCEVFDTHDEVANILTARRPAFGGDAVARFLIGIARLVPADTNVEIAEMNGAPSFVIRIDGRVDSVIVLEFDEPGPRIRAVHTIRNPDKLARV